MNITVAPLPKCIQAASTSYTALASVDTGQTAGDRQDADRDTCLFTALEAMLSSTRSTSSMNPPTGAGSTDEWQRICPKLESHTPRAQSTTSRRTITHHRLSVDNKDRTERNRQTDTGRQTTRHSGPYSLITTRRIGTVSRRTARRQFRMEHTAEG